MVQKRINQRAVNCYKKTGFIQEKYEEEAFSYKNEIWGRIHMCHRREI